MDGRRRGGRQLEAIGVHGQEPREDVLWRNARRNLAEDADYADYMRSPEWRVRREGMLDIAGGRCETCGSPDVLSTHHLHYRTFRAEEPRDLVVLCWRCHIDVQDRHDSDPRTRELARIAAGHPATFAEFFADEEGDEVPA